MNYYTSNYTDYYDKIKLWKNSIELNNLLLNFNLNIYIICLYITMKIFMPDDQIEYYKQVISKCNNYMEFGSGGSTIYASNNITGKGLSFESDEEWYNNIKNNIINKNYQVIYIDIESEKDNWGYPGNKCNVDKQKLYSTKFKEYISDLHPDVILIDGRYRVSCALQIHSYISDNCRVLFDDFLNRNHYHIVLEYYDIVTNVNNMVELKKKNNIIPNEVMDKYILVPQ